MLRRRSDVTLRIGRPPTGPRVRRVTWFDHLAFATWELLTGVLLASILLWPTP